MRFFIALLWAAVILPPLSKAQKTFPQNGVFDERESLFAFTNATIVKSWNEKLDNATLLIRNGRIEAVGVGITIPKDAVVIDVKKKYIYPSFIETFGNYGMPEIPASTAQRGGGGFFGREQFVSNKKGAYSWNEAFKTEFKAHEVFAPNDKEAEILRGVGFGTVVTHQLDGISRGSAAVVSLSDERAHTSLIKPVAAHVMSFSKGTSTQTYPTSLMGCIALLRQTYLDAQWYANGGSKEEKNLSLEAWNALQSVPQVFDVGDKLEALRAAKIASEFSKKFIIKGRGDDYQRLNELKTTGSPLILPLNFPDAYDVEDPIDALQVALSDLKHWELAPTNPSRVAAAGIDFALTTNGLRNKADFFKQVQKAIEAGLTEGDALKSLTATPARLFGLESDLGSLDRGKIASFFISDKNIFAKDAKILHNWVQGRPYVLSDLDKVDPKGTYNLTVGNQNYVLSLGRGENTATKSGDSTKAKLDMTVLKNSINILFTPSGEKGMIRLSGVVENGNMSGRGQLADGTWVNWQAEAKGASAGNDEERKNTAEAKKEELGDVIYPFIAYGRKELPKSERVLFKNATVWTNETDGILQATDVLIEGGKILQIGKNIDASTAKTVDATGKHLTAGIIDEHSHITVARGVNEGAQSSSAEVRIADVINCDDINIYRQLAGGVTSSHILHGSANSIGGQTQLIKMRFGYEPEKMKFENWPGYIKFALGENVKRANGDGGVSSRFPITRMGVEQVFDDHFTRAREYLNAQKAGKFIRRDLELEALGEILEGKRHITCHSYVQSEINMLLKTADRHGFKVNTFTHILEGYKVAEKMAKHGAAGAGFADWWNYKYEVYDAIPQNAKLMQDAGVLASINSDDAEMARRLNQEAAKSVMYANMDEVAAWKMVTLNPARTLRVDSRVGSVKVGKDADLVLWSHNPLSIYAKAEQTYVDGVKFFDRQEDVKMQDEIRKERARLVQKTLLSKKSGAATQPVQRRTQRLYDCEDEDDEMR
ncbi:MAG: amidohydrolase family protein [Saprospiraceae bacterium]|nr:amidohydrolase family protein [Saprospiraceae bacterium]